MSKIDFENRLQQNEKYRELIGKMESIVGNSCYHKYMPNYGPGGTYEGDGRWYRYPITYNCGCTKYKCYSCNRIPASDLMTGHYAFGANSLAIISAITKIIDLLEREYGLKLDEDK